MDYFWVSTCTYDKPLRYSDFNIGPKVRDDLSAVEEQHDWLGTAKERLNKEIAASCDAIVTGLYEYDVCYRPHFPDKTTFIPFPIEIGPSAPVSPAPPLKLFIGISRGRSAYKGTDIMLEAAKEVKAKYPNGLELRIANGIPFDEYVRMIDGSDAIMDQLYSYTPAMNALLAMSEGHNSNRWRRTRELRHPPRESAASHRQRAAHTRQRMPRAGTSRSPPRHHPETEEREHRICQASPRLHESGPAVRNTLQANYCKKIWQ